MIQFLLSRVVHHVIFLGSRCFIFSFPEFKVFSLYRPEAPSKSLQGFTLCCQLLFFLSSFLFTGVLHGGSTWWFIKDSFHSSIIFSTFLSKLWSAKLYSKLNRVVNTCFVLGSSRILHLAFRSAILSTLSFDMVLCHPWQFLPMFHDSHVVKNDVF